MATMTVIGLMSGTSMDGVDLAVLSTDGDTLGGFGPTHFRPYDEAEKAVLRAALDLARTLTDRTVRPGALAESERIVTDAHAEAIEAVLRANPGLKPDLVGFHGQTVFHAPHRGITIQIGDGAALAARIGIPVVYDFRAADVAAGGGGAPFVPVYHRALVESAGLKGNVVLVNIGGVANITRIGADGSLLAGDTGPGNALIDDFVRARTGAAIDRDGALAARGAVDEVALSALMADPWFDEPFPKSLDRNAFSPNPVSLLSDADGAARALEVERDDLDRALVERDRRERRRRPELGGELRLDLALGLGVELQHHLHREEAAALDPGAGDGGPIGGERELRLVVAPRQLPAGRQVPDEVVAGVVEEHRDAVDHPGCVVEHVHVTSPSLSCGLSSA